MARTATTPKLPRKTPSSSAAATGAKERPDVLVLHSPDGTVRKIGRGLKSTGHKLTDQEKAMWDEILGKQEWL